jgi:hypothetical protein
MIRNKNDSYVFTDEELVEINEIRKNYEILTDRDRFLVGEALKVYICVKKP